jgi:hypothetical protein
VHLHLGCQCWVFLHLEKDLIFWFLNTGDECTLVTFLKIRWGDQRVAGARMVGIFLGLESWWYVLLVCFDTFLDRGMWLVSHFERNCKCIWKPNENHHNHLLDLIHYGSLQTQLLSSLKIISHFIVSERSNIASNFNFLHWLNWEPSKCF